MTVTIGHIYQVRVGCIKNCSDADNRWLKHGSSHHYIKITGIRDTNDSNSRLDYDILSDNIDKLNSCNCYRISDLIINSAQPGIIKTFMNNIIEFYQNMTATPDDKLLKSLGLENPIGTPTEEGIKLSNAMQYTVNRVAIIEIAKKMEEEANKEKK